MFYAEIEESMLSAAADFFLKALQKLLGAALPTAVKADGVLSQKADAAVISLCPLPLQTAAAEKHLFIQTIKLAE